MVLYSLCSLQVVLLLPGLAWVSSSHCIWTEVLIPMLISAGLGVEAVEVEVLCSSLSRDVLSKEEFSLSEALLVFRNYSN